MNQKGSIHPPMVKLVSSVLGKNTDFTFHMVYEVGQRVNHSGSDYKPNLCELIPTQKLDKSPKGQYTRFS